MSQGGTGWKTPYEIGYVATSAAVSLTTILRGASEGTDGITSHWNNGGVILERGEQSQHSFLGTESKACLQHLQARQRGNTEHRLHTG